MVSQCVFTASNDGVALYHCSTMTIAHNDLSRNTAYAVRMFYTDSSVILGNNGSHSYRENPVNSDAGALLMIISNANRVEGNDFTYSSDGVFLGQYGYSKTPNNNLFLENDCSYSPHNAFEATFAAGNIFRKNKANYSGYGFWLGYASRTIVDSNEIIGNREQLSVGTAGIAIDRGYNTIIRHNRIDDNTTGILLWRDIVSVCVRRCPLGSQLGRCHAAFGRRFIASGDGKRVGREYSTMARLSVGHRLGSGGENDTRVLGLCSEFQ